MFIFIDMLTRKPFLMYKYNFYFFGLVLKYNEEEYIWLCILWKKLFCLLLDLNQGLLDLYAMQAHYELYYCSLWYRYSW